MHHLETEKFEDWLLAERRFAKLQSTTPDFEKRKGADLRIDDLEAALKIWREYVGHTNAVDVQPMTPARSPNARTQG